MTGNLTVSDNQGGFYRWDTTSSGSEDQFLNVVISNISASGRWVRVFQRARQTAGGAILSNTGGIRCMFITAVTDSTGSITLPLTEEGTAGGTALFSEIWSITPSPDTNATGPADAVQSYRKALAANMKTVTYGFYKANAVTITLGLLLTPVASIGAGTSVSFRIEGR